MSASSKTEDTRGHHEVSGNNSDPEGERTFSCLNIKLNFGKGTSVTENSTATKETLRLHHLYNRSPCPVTSPRPVQRVSQAGRRRILHMWSAEYHFFFSSLSTTATQITLLKYLKQILNLLVGYE